MGTGEGGSPLEGQKATGLEIMWVMCPKTIKVHLVVKNWKPRKACHAGRTTKTGLKTTFAKRVRFLWVVSDTTHLKLCGHPNSLVV